MALRDDPAGCGNAPGGSHPHRATPDASGDPRAAHDAAADPREVAPQAPSEEERLASLGRFAGDIAHQFNNQLTTILCGTEMLGARLTDAHVLAELREIHEAAERARDLAARLFTRVQPLLPAPVARAPRDDASAGRRETRGPSDPRGDRPATDPA